MTKKYTVGVRNAVFTPVTEDTVSTFTLGTPIASAGITQANINFNQEQIDHRGDDTLLEISQSFGGLTVEVQKTGLDLAVMALLTGGTYDDSSANCYIYFCHDLKSVGHYFMFEFDMVATDGSVIHVVMGKCKASNGPAYGAQDQTSGAETFTIAGVKLINQSATTKGISWRIPKN